MKLRTRFAPTPSGYLHLGNAWSFVLTWLAARSQGGFIHLRIDDLDAARFRDEYLEDIFASLHWLGLDWDSGPRDAAEFKAAHSQQLKIARYREVLTSEGLRESLYACSCSREQARRDAEVVNQPTLYAHTCRDRGLDQDRAEHVLRYRTPSNPVRARDEAGGVFELHPERDMGDFVLRQKNGEPSYQLASVVDDEDLRINFVVRGLDLIPSTGAQLSLAQTLGLENLPRARFWHHALVLDDAGEKLSKSEGAESLRSLRERFPDPSPVYRFFARHLGIEPGGKGNRPFGGFGRLTAGSAQGPGIAPTARDLLSGFRMEKVATMPLRLSDFLRESGG